MAKTGRLAVSGIMCMAVAVGQPAHAEVIRAAASRLSDALLAQLQCTTGDSVLVGIFPFDEAILPLSAQNAFRLYEGFLGEVIEGAPPCVRFIDGRGAFVTLNYLGQTGTLRETGQQQRAQIQESLASATYVLDGTVLESGGEFEAVFRLTAVVSGVAMGRVSFPVPDRFRSTACGDGALPIDTAVRRMAEAFLQRTGPMGVLIATGGRYAQTDIVTDAGAYLEELFLSDLSRASENVLSGAALRVSRSPVSEALAEPGTYTLSLRYWPCDGDASARLSVTLRSADGRDVTEARNISLTALPNGLSLRPRTATAISGDLTVSPLVATVGTELSLLAAPPAFCNPFFFNIAPSGNLTPIPLDFFRQLDLGGGRVRYEISTQSDFGLVVQENDEPGLNHLGYLCQPEQVRDMSDLQGVLIELLERLDSAPEGVIELLGLSPAYYRLAGFDIFR